MTTEIVSHAHKIIRGICVSRIESAETGQHEIKGEIKSESSCNRNKELLLYIIWHHCKFRFITSIV
jgi:hypothetical protein